MAETTSNRQGASIRLKEVEGESTFIARFDEFCQANTDHIDK